MIDKQIFSQMVECSMYGLGEIVLSTDTPDNTFQVVSTTDKEAGLVFSKHLSYDFISHLINNASSMITSKPWNSNNIDIANIIEPHVTSKSTVYYPLKLYGFIRIVTNDVKFNINDLHVTLIGCIPLNYENAVIIYTGEPCNIRCNISYENDLFTMKYKMDPITSAKIHLITGITA